MGFNATGWTVDEPGQSELVCLVPTPDTSYPLATHTIERYRPMRCVTPATPLCVDPPTGNLITGVMIYQETAREPVESAVFWLAVILILPALIITLTMGTAML